MSRAARTARQHYGADLDFLGRAVRIADALHEGRRPSSDPAVRDWLRRTYPGHDAIGKLREIEAIRSPEARVRAFAAGVSLDEGAARRGFDLWRDYSKATMANELGARLATRDRGPAPAGGDDLRDTIRRHAERADPGYLAPELHEAVQAVRRHERAGDAYPDMPIDTDWGDRRRTIAAAFDVATLSEAGDALAEHEERDE